MPFNIYDSGEGRPKRGSSMSIAPGVIANNCDLIMQGKLMVRIPALGMEVWARLASVAAGKGRGVLFNPQVDDEVLVAFNQEDPRDAYILGCLWNTSDRLPASIPTDTLTKRYIKTGMTSGVGHEVEFDDVIQTITITTSLGQTIKMGPTGIEITSGTNKITMGPPVPGASVVQVQAGTNTIQLTPTGITVTAAQTLTLTAPTVNISGGTINIKGPNVMIN
jgi:hypothetical protein